MTPVDLNRLREACDQFQEKGHAGGPFEYLAVTGEAVLDAPGAWWCECHNSIAPDDKLAPCWFMEFVSTVKRHNPVRDQDLDHLPCKMTRRVLVPVKGEN